jgi:thiamine transport system substrate-binding protein
VAAIAVGAAALVGCGGGDSGADKDSDTSKVELITYDAFVLPPAGVQAGSSTVSVLPSGDTGEMLSGAALRAERSGGDVLFGVDTVLVSRALETDLFAPLDEEVLAEVPEPYRDLGEGRLAAIDVGQVCINADTGWFEEHNLEIPTSWADLRKPEYAKLLVVENPAGSGPGLMFLAASVHEFGDTWTEFWADLNDGGVKVAADWSDAYENQYTVAGGDYPLMVSYGTSPVAEVDASQPDKPVPTVMADTCVDAVEFAGVLKGADNPEGATALVKLMLSDEYQAEIPETNYVYPIRGDIKLPEAFLEYGPRIENSIQLDPQRTAADRDEWIAEWRKIFG